jgi:spore maturation protein CgeB
MGESTARLRVLFISPFDQARHSHTALMQRALERLGCQVSPLDLLTTPPWWRRLRRAPVADRVQRAIAAVSPDVVLVIGADHLSALAVHALRDATDALWVNWIPDTQTPVEPCEHAASAYDHLFVPASALAARLTESTGAAVRFLAPGCDPSVHRPLRARDQFRANVVFAGTATPKREDLLTELVEFGLALWGPGWRKTSLRDYCRGELVDVQDYVRAYAGASVAVNIHHDAAPAAGGGCNARVFELAAIGTAQVVDDRADLSLHFTAGRDLVVFHTAEEMRRAVRELLHEHRLAGEMGREARRKALASHTYMHRMLVLLSTLEERLPSIG